MTATEIVRSETILQEIRARVLTLVKNPRASTEEMAAWELELRALGLATCEGCGQVFELRDFGLPIP